MWGYKGKKAMERSQKEGERAIVPITFEILK